MPLGTSAVYNLSKPQRTAASYETQDTERVWLKKGSCVMCFSVSVMPSRSGRIYQTVCLLKRSVSLRILCALINGNFQYRVHGGIRK